MFWLAQYNHEQSDRIPGTPQRSIKIVSLLTSLLFKMRAKLKTSKDKLKYGVYRMLTFNLLNGSHNYKVNLNRSIGEIIKKV